MWVQVKKLTFDGRTKLPACYYEQLDKKNLGDKYSWKLIWLSNYFIGYQRNCRVIGYEYDVRLKF